MHSGLPIREIAHPLAGWTTEGSRGLNCRMCGSLNVRLMRFSSSSVDGHSVSNQESLLPLVALTAGGDTLWTTPRCKNKSTLCKARPTFSGSIWTTLQFSFVVLIWLWLGFEGIHERIVVNRLQTLWISFGRHVSLRSSLAPRSVHGSFATKREIDVSVTSQPCRFTWTTPRCSKCCIWLDNASTDASEISQSPRSILSSVTLLGRALIIASTPASLIALQDRKERKRFLILLTSSVSANNIMLLSPIFSTPEMSKSKSLKPSHNLSREMSRFQKNMSHAASQEINSSKMHKYDLILTLLPWQLKTKTLYLSTS